MRFTSHVCPICTAPFSMPPADRGGASSIPLDIGCLSVGLSDEQKHDTTIVRDSDRTHVTCEAYPGQKLATPASQGEGAGASTAPAVPPASGGSHAAAPTAVEPSPSEGTIAAVASARAHADTLRGAIAAVDAVAGRLGATRAAAEQQVHEILRSAVDALTASLLGEVADVVEAQGKQLARQRAALQAALDAAEHARVVGERVLGMAAAADRSVASASHSPPTPTPTTP